MTKRKITRFFCGAAAAVCLASSLQFTPAGFGADAAGDLTAFEITEAMQLGWNLGNTLDSYNKNLQTMDLTAETSWGNPLTTQEMIDAVKAKGFSTVRVPVTWYQHVDKDNGYKINEKWLARVKEIVDYCYNADMYVILNMHHEEGWQNSATLGSDYNRIKPFVTSVWSQISETFKDYDQHLVFETMNEPRAIETDHEWWGPTQEECDVINNLNADILGVIRKSGGNNGSRLVMMPGYCASSDTSMMSKIVVPDDDYVAVSVHAYSPYGFTMDSTKPASAHETFTDAYRAELASILDGIRKTFGDKDIPVVLGEFSAANFGNTDARVEWAEAYISTTKAYGIPCVLWDNNAYQNPSNPGEAHGYLNRRELTWYDGSSQVIDKMVEVLSDSSIGWGSERKSPVITHDEITAENTILSGEFALDASVDGGNCSPNAMIKWSNIEGGEIAVKFTGDAPVIAFMDSDWKNWTEVKPYDIDNTNGIAYYSASQIKAAWGEDKLDTINAVCTRTNSKTTVTAIALLGEASGEVDPPEDNTKKYDLDLSKRSDSAQMLIVTFEGAPGSVIQGCIGYMGEEWTNIEFDDKISSNGKYSVEVFLYGKGASNTLNGIPAGITSAQAQIWWCDDADAKMTEYNILGLGGGRIDYGDANDDGVVDIADATLVLQHIGNGDEYKLSETGIRNADVCAPAGITAADSLVIQKVDAKLISVEQLPVESA